MTEEVASMPSKAALALAAAQWEAKHAKAHEALLSQNLECAYLVNRNLRRLLNLARPTVRDDSLAAEIDHALRQPDAKF